MDDTTRVARFRDEVPAEIDLTVAERRVMAHISRNTAPNSRTFGRRHYGRRLAFGGGIAVAALAVGVLIVQNLPVRDRTVAKGHQTVVPHAGSPILRSPHSAADVALNAKLVADSKPYHPRINQWIFRKTLSVAPGSGRRVTSEAWSRVDGKQTAWVAKGKLRLSGVLSTGATPGTWPRSDAAYLDSLPTDPAQLLKVINENNAAENYVIGSGHAGVFADIQALMENVPLSPRLYAALYGVLAKLPEVHVDHSTADVTGRKGIGLYMTQEGYFKAEIVIDPKTYAYLGQQEVVTADHTLRGYDGVGHVRKGQLLDWDAVVTWAIVDQPGQRP